MSISPWEPRYSVRLKIQRDTEYPGDTVRAMGSPAFARDYKALFVDECRQVMDELTADLNLLEHAQLPDCEFSLDCDSWKTEGTARLDEAGKYHLSISLGFCLALDDALLNFLAHEDVFLPITNVAQRFVNYSVDLQSFEYPIERPESVFYDYSHLQNEQFGPKDLVSSFPIDRWRLRQHDLMFRLAMRWALLHEFGHAALRHVDLLRLFWAVDHQGLTFAETSSEKALPLEKGEAWSKLGYREPGIKDLRQDQMRRVMELHADTFALWLTIDLDQLTGSASSQIFEAYERELKQMQVDADTAYIDLHNDRKCHYLLSSSLIAIALFERGRRLYGSHEINTHPSPEARLISLFNNAFYGSAHAAGDGNGGFEVRFSPDEFSPEERAGPWGRFLQDTIGDAIEDFGDFCRYVDVDYNLFSNPGERGTSEVEFYDDGYAKRLSDDELVDVSGWYLDVLAIHHVRNSAAIGRNIEFVPKSSGGHELLELRAYHQHVNLMSERLQTELNGQAFQFLKS